VIDGEALEATDAGGEDEDEDERSEAGVMDQDQDTETEQHVGEGDQVSFQILYSLRLSSYLIAENFSCFFF
jgi:hypothetical protein